MHLPLVHVYMVLSSVVKHTWLVNSGILSRMLFRENAPGKRSQKLVTAIASGQPQAHLRGQQQISAKRQLIQLGGCCRHLTLYYPIFCLTLCSYTYRPLSTHFARNLGLSRDMIQVLAQLPGTKNMDHLRDRAQALSQWKTSMQQGYLPEAGTLEWPVEPFQSSFVNALDNLGMPRFTRRYPKLLDSLLRQMMQLVHVSLQHCSACMLCACQCMPCACHGITARTAIKQQYKQAQWHDQHAKMLCLVVAMQAEQGCQSFFRVLGAKLVVSTTMKDSALAALSHSLHCVTAVLIH